MKRIKIITLFLLSFILSVVFLSLAPISWAAGTITVNPSIRYQTMTGWEATGQVGQTAFYDVKPPNGYLDYRDSLFNQAINVLGINRLRLEIKPNSAGTDFDVPTFDLMQMDRLAVPYRSKFAQSLPNEKLWLSVTVVDPVSPNNCPVFGSSTVALWKHLQSKYGLVPDGLEILEPNTFGWSTANAASCLYQAAIQLEANGFSPYIIAPSHSCVVNAPSYYSQMLAAVPQLKNYVKEFAYHQYCGSYPDSTLTDVWNNYGKNGTVQQGRTAQLEGLAHDYRTLHRDLKFAHVSSWQKYALYFPACDPKYQDSDYFVPKSWLSSAKDCSDRTPVLNPLSNWFRQYFHYIRDGAVAIEATSTDAAVDPLAFINKDGRYVVVVKATSPNQFSISGLPAGTYGLEYTTRNNNSNKTLPDVTISAGQAIITSIPNFSVEGVMTIYGKTAGSPLPTPTPTRIPTAYPTSLPTVTSIPPTTSLPTATPMPTQVPIGDGDADGTPPVTTNDVLVLFPKWNSLGALPLDQYGDGVINTLDFSVVANKLVSPTSSLPTATPYPTSAPTSAPSISPTGSGGGSAGVPKCMRYPILASTLPSSSWGSGYAQLDTVNNVLTYKFQFKNLSSAATAAHIHGYAPRSTTTLAPTLHTITIPAATTGSVSGSWTYPEADEGNILKGLAYINIHTANKPAGEVAYWLDGGVPCVPTGQSTLPVCTSHDPKAYHALIDPVNNCHYNHEHKENPHDIDDVLGAPGKWWSDMYTLIGQNVPAQETSYPWLTANGLENMMYKDASGNIIGGKHESYGNIVRKDMPGSASKGGGFLKHFRMHTHMDLHAQGNLTRYHSYEVEGVICTKANPSDCGTFRFGGHGDYEELNVKVGNTLVHVPLATDPKVTPRPGQTLAQALRESLARHDHASQVTGQDGLVFNDWYATRKNDLVETALKDTPFNYVTYNIFTNDGFTTTDPANPAIDPANPATLHLTCPDFKCPRNNSTVSLARILVTMRSPNPYVGSNGKINYRGFTDRYGNELPGACKTKGCVPTTKCTAGPDCVPMEAIDLPDLGAGGPDFSDRTSKIEVRDYDTSPAVTGIGSEWWIEFPN